jgi:hypothetical protein
MSFRKIRKEAEERIKERLDEEAVILSDPDTSKEDYLRSICRCVKLYQESKNHFYERRKFGTEGLEEYRDRVQKAGLNEYDD